MILDNPWERVFPLSYREVLEGVCIPIGGTTIWNNQYTPELPGNQNTNQRVHMVGLMAPAAYVAEDGLVGHQWEGPPLVPWRLHAL